MKDVARAIIFATGYTPSALKSFTIKATARNFTGCAGSIATRTCRLVLATVNYAIALTSDSIALQHSSDSASDRRAAEISAFSNSFSKLHAAVAAAHTKVFPASRIDLSCLPPIRDSPPRGYSTHRLWDCAPSVTESAPECGQENMDFGWDTSLRYSMPGRKSSAYNLLWLDPMDLSLRRLFFFSYFGKRRSRDFFPAISVSKFTAAHFRPGIFSFTGAGRARKKFCGTCCSACANSPSACPSPPL
jgi:hypothetical protein